MTALSSTIGQGLKLSRPYGHLAAAYDNAFGIPFFRGTRIAFERLVRRYGIRFSSVADLGCGTGLFAHYLSERWAVPVIGVDRSDRMLFEAARRCRDSEVVLLCQDIRRLRLPYPVDLITANFDTLNHLLTPRDLCTAMRRVALNLRPGGHFLFDFVTDCQPLREFRTRLQHERGGVRQCIRWDPSSRILRVSIVVQSTHGGAPTVELHHERAYAPSEVAQCLFRAGFRIRGVLDATTLRPANRCAARVIVVAQKLIERPPG